MAEKTEKRCFMEISINGKPRGKIDFKLYNDVVPETCYNFLQLCIGSEKLGEMTGKKLTYQGSTFHRVVKGFMIQGGDFSKHDGTGGECIYSRHNGIFDDENFSIKFDKPYILAMANRGPNTNGSQFFITTSECPSLNGKHVAFGEVVRGHEIVNAIENCEVNSNSRPMADIIITNCGELKR
uniref:Peptidyl-prolyl cis-trans isomerase n=1 Tax=Panagrolaimus sp. PS1159 TaxID=55785 RepID=A0AC35GVW8_9BILA